MKTASAQLETEVVRPALELAVVSSPGYSGVWELAADGIYRYVPNGNYYYRPLLANGKRTYRSLKTQNLKLAKARYQALGSQNGPAARVHRYHVGRSVRIENLHTNAVESPRETPIETGR